MKAAAKTAIRSRPARAAGKGILLALGDSWFNYFPPFDVLVALQRKYGWRVQSVAVPGSSLAGLLPGGAAARQLPAMLALAQGLDGADKAAVKAILISGGGNDIVDPVVFPPLLNPAADGPPALNEQAFAQCVDVALRQTLLQVLQAATALSLQALGRAVPIVIHGYDHPVPDGRAFRPAESQRALFATRGHRDLAANTAVMATMIDRLNAMQLQLLHDHRASLPHVVHADLRGTLCGQPAGRYKADWQNELHPTIPDGFTRVADRLQAVLARL